MDLIKLFPLSKIPFVAFGGISSSAQVANLANESRISAVAIGNFLNYREHAIQSIKKEINSNLFRFAEYYSAEII